MPQQPIAGGGQNQTLLELIYSLKGLAQTIEYLHQDIFRKFDEESRARSRDLDQLRDSISKDSQALSTLPTVFSDRTEKLLGKLENDLSRKFEELDKAIKEVRERLEEYTRVTGRTTSQNESVVPVEKKADVTGKIELTERGDIRVQMNSQLLKKIGYATLAVITGGGAYEFYKVIRELIGGN